MEPAGPARQTVVGLFEDTIDAEQALIALRKADYAPERISVLVRDKAADQAAGDRHGAVARAVVATALDAVGGWLRGLASLIVPERGTFLVAGPIGAALAGISAGEAPGEAGGALFSATTTTTADLSSPGLRRTLEEFGFGREEATYLEHRLAAGAAFVALTTASGGRFQTARRIFADHNAVYIGMARTEAAILAEAEALLAAPPEASSGGDVFVTDAVAPLVKGCRGDGPAPIAALCGRAVVDVDGIEVGEIEEVLADPTAGRGERPLVRYLVVGFGGVLGLGRRHAPVPAGVADTGADPIRLEVDRDVLHRAPSYDDEVPFSRREEQAVCAYFGFAPYWLAEEGGGEPS